MNSLYRTTGLLLLTFLFPASSWLQHSIAWQPLEPGLSFAEISLPIKSTVGDSKVQLLRINPDSFTFKLICAGQLKKPSQSIAQWAKEHQLLAAVNASMFKLEGDFNVSTGYMRNGKYINNATLNPKYNNALVFNSSASGLPSAQIVDLKCQDWNTISKQYSAVSQNIRIIDCAGKNLWQHAEKKWSMVLMGQDAEGYLLFIFVRSPYGVRQFADQLLAQPLQLQRLMYLEGGPEASFYINHPVLKVENMGSYETGFNENDNNKTYWNLPNIVGIVRR